MHQAFNLLVEGLTSSEPQFYSPRLVFEDASLSSDRTPQCGPAEHLLTDRKSTKARTLNMPFWHIPNLSKADDDHHVGLRSVVRFEPGKL